MKHDESAAFRGAIAKVIPNADPGLFVALESWIDSYRRWKATPVTPRGRRRRGRPSDQDRLNLEAWVYHELEARGIRVTKARTGKYAKVLDIVYQFAGIKYVVDVFDRLKTMCDGGHQRAVVIKVRPEHVRKVSDRN